MEMTASGHEPDLPPDKARSSGGGLAGPLRVFLFRHGDAGLRSAWTGEDAERPLITEGRKQVRFVAKRLSRLGVKPDVILTSPYARAVQTAAITAKVLGLEDQVAVEPALQPGFHITELPPIVRAHAGATAVMLVGHEPDFSSLIGALCGGGQVALEKSGVAEVLVDHAHAFRGVLVWLAQPDRLV